MNDQQLDPQFANALFAAGLLGWFLLFYIRDAIARKNDQHPNHHKAWP
jgi:hypothetical protein